MKSKISFENINYRKALLYLAINMHKTDQRTSALWRILPRRTSQGGVRPGVTTSPDKEDHWFFPTMQLTDREKRMVVDGHEGGGPHDDEHPRVLMGC